MKKILKFILLLSLFLIPVIGYAEEDCSLWNDGTAEREYCRIANALERIAAELELRGEK